MADPSLLHNPAVIGAGILGVLGFGGSLVNAFVAHRAAQASQRTAEIVQGNGKGNVAEMTEFILDEVVYMRGRLDAHLEDKDAHVG